MCQGGWKIFAVSIKIYAYLKIKSIKSSPPFEIIVCFVSPKCLFSNILFIDIVKKSHCFSLWISLFAAQTKETERKCLQNWDFDISSRESF